MKALVHFKLIYTHCPPRTTVKPVYCKNLRIKGQKNDERALKSTQYVRDPEESENESTATVHAGQEV